MGIKYIYKVVYKSGDVLEHYNLLSLSSYMNNINIENNYNHFISLNSVKNMALKRNIPSYIDTFQKYDFKQYYNIDPNDRRKIDKIYNIITFNNKIKNDLKTINK